MKNISIKKEFSNALEAINRASSICIISHRRPDADAVGSNLALRYMLEKMGKRVISASVDPVPEDSLFLESAETFYNDFDYNNFDLIITVDCGATGLVGFDKTKPEILSGEKTLINFDHHESNDLFGTINIVDAESPATCSIMLEFFKFAHFDFDRKVATALMHGIYFDTGGLQHSNTTAEVYESCSVLLSKGADLKKIVKHQFKTTKVSKLRLWGKILERAYINEENVVVSAVSAMDYLICGANSNDTGGAIDFLNMVPGTNYCVMLSENERGLVKGSLRTQRDDVNLSTIASQWGGGGHPKASGFGLEGKLKPITKWQIIANDGQMTDF